MVLCLVEWLRRVAPQFASLLEAAWGEHPAVRALVAAVVAFLAARALAPPTIAALRRFSLDPNKSDSDRLRHLHASKSATPTMGGLFVVAAWLAAMLVCADLRSPFVGPSIALWLGLAGVGALDDLVKLRSARNGLAPRSKLALQLVLAAAVAVWAFAAADGPAGAALCWPLGAPLAWLGIACLPLAVLAVVGTSNAVNLADGLDGLAAGCLLPAAAVLALAAAVCGDPAWAALCGATPVPGCGEMAVAGAALLGSAAAFLQFNRHPAQVFLGDTGSLPLGGMLGWIAVASRQELLLVVVGGVFVAEALSVVVQVGSWKLRRQRVFRCAPLHHHFQFGGWPEVRIVRRFWMAGLLCAAAGLALAAGSTWRAAQCRQAAADRPATLAALEPGARAACPPWQR